MFDPKKAGEEADRMIAELNQPKSTDAAVEDQPTSNEAIPETDIDTTEGTTEVAVSQQSQPNTQQDSALAELKKQLDAAEQRWKVLQGMIDKKDDEIENMRMVLAQVQTQNTPSTDQGVKAASSEAETEVRDIYGESVLTAMESIAARVFAQKFAEFTPKFQEVQREVTATRQTVAQSAQERFVEQLTNEVPDWETLNVDQGYLGWLQMSDPLSGVKRLSLLRDAFAVFDTPRVVRFFNMYKEEAGLTRKETPAPTPQPSADVRRLVAPGKSKGTSVKVESGSTKQWSRADISKLYDDKMKGKISQSDFESLERDLFKAQSEGRIAA